jgi:release factor glutamine methyltransferase
MNIQQALQYAAQSFAETSPSANLDAQVLLSHILTCNSAHLIAWPEKELNEQQLERFKNAIKQRQQGTPIAHLTGQREFWSLNFKVNDSTLIPRPETETLVEFILDTFGEKENLTVLDMGTGAGAIAISLASEKPDWNITASDISSAALTLAKENSEALNTKNITFIQSDWFKNIKRPAFDGKPFDERQDKRKFDIIVSNPPYIAIDDPHLAEGDVRFEPETALISGITGMDDIQHLCSQAKNYLSASGWLIVEHGYNQKTLTAECFTRNGYKNICQRDDLAGHCRMTAGVYE